MTDRELLENAAKAAEEWPSPEPFEHVLNRWNPLTDDGDALRLAVKLKLDIEFDAESRYPHHVLVEQYNLGFGFREDLLDDPLAATRRAIVRAAAEIGRNT